MPKPRPRTIEVEIYDQKYSIVLKTDMQEADVRKAREALIAVMDLDKLVLHDPAPSVTVNRFLGDGMELAVRPWCDPIHYWDVYFSTLEEGKRALEEAGIKTPTPERKVHLYPH